MASKDATEGSSVDGSATMGGSLLHRLADLLRPFVGISILLSTDVLAESFEIHVQAGKGDAPLPTVEYSTKPGVLDPDSYWTTVDSNGTQSTFHPTPPRQWQSATSGVIVLDMLAVESTCFVRSPGYELSAVPVPAAGAGKSKAVVVLEPVNEISGVVVGPNNIPVPGAPILLGPLPTDFPEWDLDAIAVGRSDENGEFRLRSYPRKSPLLLTSYSELFAPGYALVTDTAREIIIELCTPASLSANISGARWWMPERPTVIVWFLSSDGTAFARLFPEVSRGGSFKLDFVPGGKIRLFTARPRLFSAAFTYETEIDVGCGEDVTISIPGTE